VYLPADVRALCQTAHSLGYRVHMDGARFANAVAAAGCEARALTVDAGVDALTFGGTKNGLAFGEAIVFFKQADSPGAFVRAIETFPFHRKATGHLLSKHRFVAAPFEAVLQTGAWLTHAAHANAMAARLAAGLRSLGFSVPYPTQANAVFVHLTPETDAQLRARGHGYYLFGPNGLMRLMCSFNTTPEDVDALLADAATIRNHDDTTTQRPEVT
jgi:threonine aldolase